MASTRGDWLPPLMFDNSLIFPVPRIEQERCPGVKRSDFRKSAKGANQVLSRRVPEGLLDNSPAFQRRERVATGQSPVGTAELGMTSVVPPGQSRHLTSPIRAATMLERTLGVNDRATSHRFIDREKIPSMHRRTAEVHPS